MNTELLEKLGYGLGAFLLGSIPFGILMARVFGAKDLRKTGSGNIGATNVARAAGFWPAGALTFLLDLLKGAVPVLLLRLSLLPQPFSAEWSETEIWTIGLVAVLGHCFSPWVRFKGGKGVATGFGALLVLSWMAALAGFIAFVFAFARARVSSVASFSGLAVAAIFHMVFHSPQAYLFVGAALLFLILFRHEKNLDALLENRENRF